MSVRSLGFRLGLALPSLTEFGLLAKVNNRYGLDSDWLTEAVEFNTLSTQETLP